ncbi:MAG: bifunctional UDP-N-acetylglucosamine diphosphorylase/glucosamine-1-phosphate N-acetyltransferase GlmU [Coriobacteriia bacterium]|nr:bifunctional UDP-N-acetylglucosamine diphosphorylase/glucosamine-1-phosphate N-acetyltransferase GlmU [Coriobacteriia bacterium]
MSAVALVLAAGEGTRMRSEIPKVAHEVLGVPMVRLVVDAATEAGCERVVVVTGHKAELTILPRAAHAVMCAREALADAAGSLVVLSGDTPLLKPETIAALIAAREDSGAVASVLTTHLEDPSGYGRIVRDENGALCGIVEHKDATAGQLAIDEINTGTYCFDAAVLFEHLDRLSTDNAQGEFYLTDMVGIFASEGLGVVSASTDDPAETLGVNSRVQLAEASKVLQGRINERHMLAGVTMVDPSLVWIAPTVTVGRDVTLEPMTFLMGDTSIADGAHLGPNTRVTDSSVGADARVDSSVVVSATVGERVTVGPVAYLRPGAILEAGSRAGTCVEIKNSVVGEGSKVPHLSYIGDATIGRGANIGAGTITCNYDGVRKHRTVIGDGAFVGSDTMLVAPVRIGADAVTAAGSAISRDVPDGSLGIERCEQRAVEGWTERKRARQSDET